MFIFEACLSVFQNTRLVPVLTIFLFAQIYIFEILKFLRWISCHTWTSWLICWDASRIRCTFWALSHGWPTHWCLGQMPPTCTVFMAPKRGQAPKRQFWTFRVAWTRAWRAGSQRKGRNSNFGKKTPKKWIVMSYKLDTFFFLQIWNFYTKIRLERVRYAACIKNF